MNPTPATIDRQQAARLLRDIRAASHDEMDELLDWALSYMPWSRPLQRLKIRRLLDQGDLEAAEALIAKGLLLRPTDPALTLLKGRALAGRERFPEAQAELRLALKQRPWHVGALELAAYAAGQLGDHAHAAALLEQAASRRANDDGLKRRLVEALLAADLPVRAEEVLNTIESSAMVLKSRLLRCQNRPLDALAVLEEAIEQTDAQDSDEQLEALTDLLEEIADTARLRDAISKIGPDHPRAHLRTCRALLSLGDFNQCAMRAQGSASNPTTRREALHALVVASAEADRHRHALDALCELTSMANGLNPRRMAECWLRAFKGRMIQRQLSAETAGADPSLKLLPAVLNEAVAVFDERLADAECPPSPAERSSLQQYRSVCLIGLGRHREADAAVARSLVA